MPNWNSMTMPVATPMAKLMPNSVPQNRVMRRQIVAPGHHVDALHDRDHEGQAERQRHEQEVVHRGQRELQARQLDYGHVRHGASYPVEMRAFCASLDLSRIDLDQGRRDARDATMRDAPHFRS